MTENTVGREPIQIVEIVQPRCANTFGSAPCTATASAGSECYNTRKTCQDPANYSGTKSLTWRFSKPSARRTMDTYTASSGDFASNPYPSLLSASTSPTIINAGGTSKSMSAFGVRATLTVTLQDHPDTDSFADPYVSTRSYIPVNQGTFWGKWLARNPYYNKYIIRVYDGYHGQALGSMQSREYMIDHIDLNSASGTVTITSKDPLRLADSDRSMIPPISDMKLKADITNVATAVSVLCVSTTVNDDLFDTVTRYVLIGDEIISYTGTTETIANVEYALTGVVRGVLGTTADAHSLDDSLQRVASWSAASLETIIEDLLGTQSGISMPSAYMPTADWLSEVTGFAPEFGTMTAYITEPMAVNKLIGEMAEQCGFYIWWDERAKEIKLRFIRPPSDAPTVLTEAYHIQRDSVSIVQDQAQRISRVFVSYNPFNVAHMDKKEDYANAYIALDASAESSDQYDEIRTKSILSRWLSAEVQAGGTAAKLLSRYRDTMQTISFRLDAKDKALWTGDVVDLEHRSLQQYDGSTDTRRYQIISAEEVGGEMVKYKAQALEFTGNFARWMDSSAPDYATATDAEKDAGGWWSDTGGLMLDGSDGYKWQ